MQVTKLLFYPDFGSEQKCDRSCDKPCDDKLFQIKSNPFPPYFQHYYEFGTIL